MSIPAHIVIITKQPVDRYEFITDGAVYFDANNTCFLEYVDDKNTVTIGIAADTVTITRCGEDNYSMFIHEGACEPLEFEGLNMIISTTKVKITSSTNKISARLAYSFSHKGEPIEGLDFNVKIYATY